METQGVVVDFTLSPIGLSFTVDVRLNRVGERWVARVTARGEERVALGPSPRQALTAALAPLGTPALTVLLADLGLLEPSIRVAQAAAPGPA